MFLCGQRANLELNAVKQRVNELTDLRQATGRQVSLLTQRRIEATCPTTGENPLTRGHSTYQHQATGQQAHTTMQCHDERVNAFLNQATCQRAYNYDAYIQWVNGLRASCNNS